MTGAGLSEESGIPTFRGKDGLWRRHDPMTLATVDAFARDPGLVWEWYEDRRRNIAVARPNAGHAAISALEEFVHVDVLTQNVDGLHGAAGSSCIHELHGNILRVRCTACGHMADMPGAFDTLPPRCTCGGMLRPDVVWFGEPLRQDVWGRAIRVAGMADVMIIAGTSLQVSPANTLPIHARGNGALLVEVNPEETPMSGIMDLCVRDKAGVLAGLVSLFVRGTGGTGA